MCQLRPSCHRKGQSLSCSALPCLLTVEVWTPGQRSSRWQDGPAWVWEGELWSESLLVGRTCRLCVLISPAWVPQGSRFPGPAQAVLLSPSPLPACCLLPPASSSPHFLHFPLTLAGSGGRALGVSSSPPAWARLWGRRERSPLSAQPCGSLLPGASHTLLPPGPLGHPQAPVHGTQGRALPGSPSLACLLSPPIQQV